MEEQEVSGIKIVGTDALFQDLKLKHNSNKRNSSMVNSLPIFSRRKKYLPTLKQEDLTNIKSIVLDKNLNDIFKGYYFSTKHKDISFVNGRIGEAIEAFLFSLGIDFENIKHDKTITNWIVKIRDDYIKGSEEKSNKTNKMYELLMFEVQ